MNNAGTIKDSLLIRMSVEDFDNVVALNLRGTFLCTRLVLRDMLRNRWGRVVNIGSVVGIAGNVGQSNYAASKAAVIGFTKSVAKEVASRNITVNCVAPGYVTTDIVEDLPQELKGKILERIHMRRFGSVQEVADLVSFLVRDEAAYITGQVIAVDGRPLPRRLVWSKAARPSGARWPWSPAAPAASASPSLTSWPPAGPTSPSTTCATTARRATLRRRWRRWVFAACACGPTWGIPQSIQALVNAVEQEYGRLDILVNNAASGVQRPAMELEEHHWDWTLDVNARGPWLCTKEAVRLMPEGGSVVNLTSLGSQRVLPFYTSVGVSKAALEALTRYLAVELAPRGIRVNAVSAGYVDTDALRTFPNWREMLAQAQEKTPGGSHAHGRRRGPGGGASLHGGRGHGARPGHRGGRGPLAPGVG